MKTLGFAMMALGSLLLVIFLPAYAPGLLFPEIGVSLGPVLLVVGFGVLAFALYEQRKSAVIADGRCDNPRVAWSLPRVLLGTLGVLLVVAALALLALAWGIEFLFNLDW